MTLQDILREIHHLSAEERRHLREYIDELEQDTRGMYESPEERIRQMDAAVAAIREGMTQAQIDDMIEAMNAETVEPFDEDTWKD
jgi:hypothetical protein